MKPIITKQGKLAQLRYELPHRVHDAKVYPVKAPNGSTIILYAFESGVRIIWRGGRPLKPAAPASKQPAKPPKVNGTSNDAIMIIDSDDESSPAPPAAPSAPLAEFEDDDEELDPDRPYPTFVQELYLSLNAEVLHIAVPQVPAVTPVRTADTIPAVFSKRMVFTVACADYSVRVITLPLSPPSDAAKDVPSKAKSQFGEEIVRVPTHAGHQSIPCGISMTWTSRAEPTFEEDPVEDEEMEEAGATMTPGRRVRRRQTRSRSARRGDSEGWDLLVASHSMEIGGLLKIWRFGLSETSVTATNPFFAYKTVTLQTPATRVIFNSAQYPRRRHSQLLITDSTGIARIYDPFAPTSRRGRKNLEPGRFVAAFRTTFEQSKANTPFPPILATRKPILDAAWTSDGHGIFALLGDGEWGIWDLDRTGPNPPADPSNFSLRGFVSIPNGLSPSNSDASSPKSKGTRNQLVPMTPNTRRTKSEDLFQGTSSSSPGPTRGGVSVASLQSNTGALPEDSVVIWYGSEAWRIPNLGQFWTKSAAARDNAGSLSAPSLSKIQGLNLFGEAITSLCQFETTIQEARMAIPRDVLISAEHRLIIATTTAEPRGRDLNAVFARERAQEEDSRRTDQALLARGELDLGGMDRMLEDMENSGSRSMVLGNPRKVLFASSTGGRSETTIGDL